MNLTLYHVVPMDETVRPLYILAPNPAEAALTAKWFIPVTKSITAVANNAHMGETFPRFIGRDE